MVPVVYIPVGPPLLLPVYFLFENIYFIIKRKDWVVSMEAFDWYQWCWWCRRWWWWWWWACFCWWRLRRRWWWWCIFYLRTFTSSSRERTGWLAWRPLIDTGDVDDVDDDDGDDDEHASVDDDYDVDDDDDVFFIWEHLLHHQEKGLGG